ncbi:GNAT family N-acetyltransferase [Candidatus Margulisiibacteriota bacterium]
MTIDIEIRKALKKDVKKVVNLAKESRMITPRFKAGECLIAIRGENLIGMARLKTFKAQKAHELSSVTVKDGWRNCGIGGMLVSKAVKIAKYDVYLNTVNPSFYVKMGFKISKTKPKMFAKNGMWCKGCSDKKACTPMIWHKD